MKQFKNNHFHLTLNNFLKCHTTFNVFIKRMLTLNPRVNLSLPV